METLSSNGHSVYFDDNFIELSSFLAQGNYSKIFFLADTNTEEKCLPLLTASLKNLPEYDIIEVDPGEENKNIDYCIGIWRMLLDFGADRNSLLINVGGGVVTDMGGFAASTYKRGIDFVQVPTTLLAQVDASVGGKTGIDMAGVKNIIGTFTQPKAVFICTDFLKTLDNRQIISGFAEVIKHGLIYDRAYFELLKEAGPLNISPELIHRSVEIKNEVVLADPLEHGLRKILNFGHTIGHAIESYSLLHDKKHALLHGEALAIGMICEAYLSNRHNNLGSAELDRIVVYIREVFPGYKLSINSYPDLLELMQNDKKNNNENIGFSLLQQIGKCTFNHYLDVGQIKESLDFYVDL